MVWVSGAKLAASVSNNGCLGLIGAGSMKPELLKEHLKKAKSLTDKPYGVNIPLLYSKVSEQIEVSLRAGVKIFFTSAGSPKKFTSELKKENCTVVHVASSPVLALKCQDAGVDAVVVEGFEAGGHNGRDELTTMALVPAVANLINIPLIAAGGIFDGRGMAAAFCLGADGVQLGTRFAATVESSAHSNFKDAIMNSKHGDTSLCMKKLVPVRLLKNKFYDQVRDLESRCAPESELIELLGRGRAKKGMLEGDLIEGELEIGQVSSEVNSIQTVSECVEDLLSSYEKACSFV